MCEVPLAMQSSLLIHNCINLYNIDVKCIKAAKFYAVANIIVIELLLDTLWKYHLNIKKLVG